MTNTTSATSNVLLGAVVGAVAMSLAMDRSRKPLPQLAVWRRELASNRGSFEAARLVGLVQARYDELYPSRPRFSSRAVQAHLEHRILPTLALYQTLRDVAPTQQAALEETGTLLRASTEQRRRLFALLGKLPDPYAAFRLLAKPFARAGFPEEGWHIDWVENSDSQVAFDIRDRCPYRDTYVALGAPELAPQHCTLDDWLYEPLSRWVRFERTGTLAQGCDRCDFRYRRASPQRL